MWPIGLFKCTACGGQSFFSDRPDPQVGETCLCFVGFGVQGEVLVKDLPDGCIIIYHESQLNDFVKHE